jgi:hypothetical protein
MTELITTEYYKICKDKGKDGRNDSQVDKQTDG